MRRTRITITLRQDVINKLDTIIDGSKNRNRSNAIETILLERFKHNILNKALMLGAVGEIEIKGVKVPKMLIPLKDGRTLLEHNIEILKNIGISEFILDTGSFKEQIQKIFGNGSRLDIKINYLEKKAGTAGIILDARNMLDTAFFMCNGDILLKNIDIEDLYLFHRKNKGIATVAVAAVPEHTNFGSIHMKGHFIENFIEKAGDPDKGSNLVNVGIYVFEPKIFDHIKSTEEMLEHEVFPRLAGKKELVGYPIGRNWIHLHDSESYEEFLKN